MAEIGGTSVAEVRKETPISRLIDVGTPTYAASVPMPAPLTAEELARLTMPTYVAFANTKSLAGGQEAVNRAEPIDHVTTRVWPDTTHSLPMQVHSELVAVLLGFWSAADG